MDVEGRRGRSRPYVGWLDRVKKACNARLLELREARVKCVDIQDWRVFVNSANGVTTYKRIEYDRRVA